MNGTWIRRFGAVGAAAVLSGTAALAVGATSASAAPVLQILPTTTTITASPSPLVLTSTPQTETFTATVGPLDLLITPTGSVTFSATFNGEAGGTETVPLSSCLILLKQCTATLSIPATATNSAAGTYVFTAHYSGDALSKPSSGSVTLIVTDAPTP